MPGGYWYYVPYSPNNIHYSYIDMVTDLGGGEIFNGRAGMGSLDAYGGEMTDWRAETFSGMGWSDPRYSGSGWTATIGSVTINYNSLNSGLTNIQGDFGTGNVVASNTSIEAIRSQYDSDVASANAASAAVAQGNLDAGNLYQSSKSGAYVQIRNGIKYVPRTDQIYWGWRGPTLSGSGNWLIDQMHRDQQAFADNPFGGAILGLPTFFAGGALAAIGRILKLGAPAANAAKGAETFFEGASYTQKVLNQMDKVEDLRHAFPQSVDGFAAKFGQWFTKMGGDGKVYQWLEMEGSWGGKTGTFQYIKDAFGAINHRFFKFP